MQEPGQSAANYIDALTHKVVRAYPDDNDSTRRGKVRERFIDGCANDKTREEVQMMSGPLVAISDMVVIASRREVVDRQQKKIVRTTNKVTAENTPSVRAVSATVKPAATSNPENSKLKKELADLKKRMNNYMNSPSVGPVTQSSAAGYTPVNKRSPPTACLCGGWHWFNECPKRKTNASNYQSTSPPNAATGYTPSNNYRYSQDTRFSQPNSFNSSYSRGGYRGRGGRGGYRGRGQGRGNYTPNTPPPDSRPPPSTTPNPPASVSTQQLNQ